jgi:lysophospholipase L1-like esterase
MMKLELVCAALAAMAGLGVRACAAQDQLLAPAGNDSVLYEGRYAPGPGGSVRLGFPGVTAHLRFRGKALSLRARASGEVFLDVIVDEGEPRRVRLGAGEGTYEIVRSPGASEHTVAIVRCNESWQGTCEYLGFELGQGGKLLPAPGLPQRRLMFIGDSVTCGELAAWLPGGDTKDKANANARLSYGMILARRLGAQCHLVGYGGRGIVRDWQGMRDTRNAPQFYELALPDDPSAAWRHADYVPDAVGIQLGTNDFNQGIPDQNEFVNTYVEFVRKVRRDAPGSLIFLMDSPILTDEPTRGPRRTALHAYLAQVVERVGDRRVILVGLGHYPGVPGNGHPTGAEHVAMADELEPVVRKALGW